MSATLAWCRGAHKIAGQKHLLDQLDVFAGIRCGFDCCGFDCCGFDCCGFGCSVRVVNCCASFLL